MILGAPWGSILEAGVAKKAVRKNDEKRVYLSTAHFSKFFNTVSDSLKINLIYPQKLKEILEKKEQYLIISNQVDEIKKVIDEKNFNRLMEELVSLLMLF